MTTNKPWKKLGLVAAVIIVLGVLFYFSMLPPTKIISTSNSSSAASTPAGFQLPDGTPQGTWTTYLGYIPQGYTVAPLTGAAPNYPCPTGMNATQCAVFHQTCGNGVCDPNETCSSCPLDCTTSGAEVCDPFTGRAGSPASICQQIITGPGA